MGTSFDLFLVLPCFLFSLSERLLCSRRVERMRLPSSGLQPTPSWTTLSLRNQGSVSISNPLRRRRHCLSWPPLKRLQRYILVMFSTFVPPPAWLAKQIQTCIYLSEQRSVYPPRRATSRSAHGTSRPMALPCLVSLCSPLVRTLPTVTRTMSVLCLISTPVSLRRSMRLCLAMHPYLSPQMVQQARRLSTPTFNGLTIRSTPRLFRAL